MTTLSVFHATARGDARKVRNQLQKATYCNLDLNCLQNAHVAVVETFLEWGACLDAQNEDGMTALMWAAQTGNLHVVNVLLENHAEVDLRNKNGMTALMMASQKGHTAVAQTLLEHNAQINLQNEAAMTSLTLASQNNQASVVECLFKHTARSALQDNDLSALLIAAENGHTSVIDFFLRHDAAQLNWLLQCLMHDDDPHIQRKAANALSNIAAGTSDHTQMVIDAGAVPMLIHLLNKQSDSVRGHEIWALSNIAGDSIVARDLILSHDVVPALQNLVQSKQGTPYFFTTIRDIAWMLTNLCRGKPSPDIETIKLILILLDRFIPSYDCETVENVCWTLSYISEGSDAYIQAVLDSGFAPKVMQFLTSDSIAVRKPAIKTIAHLTNGTVSQTQTILDLNLLPLLVRLLLPAIETIYEDISSTIANITAGTAEQIQAVIESGIFPMIIALLTSSKVAVQENIGRSLLNVTNRGTADQIFYLVEKGAIAPLCQVLRSSDTTVVSFALDCLHNILKAASSHGCLGMVVGKISDCGGVQAIEGLRTHERNAIQAHAIEIVELHLRSFST